jgi:hypothetical protein
VERDDTLLRPFKLIPGVCPSIHLLGLLWTKLLGAVHHWDENGLRDGELEPKEIRQIHSEIVEFVKAWLEDWKRPLTRESSESPDM